MRKGAGHCHFGSRLDAQAVEVPKALDAHEKTHGGGLAFGEVAVKEHTGLSVVECQHLGSAGGGEKQPEGGPTIVAAHDFQEIIGHVFE